MKTINVLKFKKVALAATSFVFTILCSNMSMQAAENSIPFSKNVAISANTQNDFRAYEISTWLRNELNQKFERQNLNNGKYNATIDLMVGRNGEIAKYEIKCDNKTFEKSLNRILSGAPAFQLLLMNGYPAKTFYSIPVTIVVR